MPEKITPIVMPKWGLTMTEGTLSAWHVAEGQTISPGQEIMDVETDKIANAVEAADGGLLRRRVAQVGQVYPVKSLLGVMAPVDVPDAEIDSYISDFKVPVSAEGEEEEATSYRFVETPSGRLRYIQRSGEGAAVLFIHGFGGDLNNWLFNIDALSGPVFALDLPGHGGSAKAMANPGLEALAAAVVSFMDAQKLSAAHLVGHSMGGAVAGLVALQEPRLVRSLTLISPAGLGPEINARYIDGFVASESRRDLKPVLQYLFADADLVSRSMVEDLLKYKRLDGVQQALRGLAAALFKDGRQALNLVEDLARLKLPIQVVWGVKDAIIPAAHAKALPNARVEIIDAAGHMAQMEAAGRVNDLIKAQIAR
ncbi:MAG TPA: acetoin dehydrogenase dihydrolipoyllysine-residue acetyltransferase subunit [Dongiaceae bacterium]|nr:acetoin dehydrogenase dihydrolipoyllysine-residue acetyltransferase subunit [Dongiaceae bacterium]